MRASVIVRTQDSERTVEGILTDLREQTVRPEVLVVDSGSTDRTVELTRPLCDRLLELPRDGYRPGRALNLAAAEAAAPVHFALSSHCRLTRRDWIERSLAHFADERVAAVNGAERLPDSSPLPSPFLQTAADARRHPLWGLSNHASAWRADVWREHAFDERLPTAEDKEWAIRVLDAGWLIAFDSALWVEMSHRWRRGALVHFRRERQETAVVGSYLPLPPYGLREVLHDWWTPPDQRHSPFFHRVNYRRIAGLAGRYLGHRAAARPKQPGPG